MSQNLKIISTIDCKKWGEFVSGHLHGNIFQTPEMAEVYKDTKNYDSITLAVIDSKSGEILVLL